MRVVPRAPCLPTPKPRWPLRLRLLPPVGLTSFRRLWLRGKRGPLGCTAIGEQLRNFGAVPPPSSPGRPPRGFSTDTPLGAVLEQILTGLDAVMAPSAFPVDLISEIVR